MGNLNNTQHDNSRNYEDNSWLYGSSGPVVKQNVQAQLRELARKNRPTTQQSHTDRKFQFNKNQQWLENKMRQRDHQIGKDKSMGTINQYRMILKSPYKQPNTNTRPGTVVGRPRQSRPYQPQQQHNQDLLPVTIQEENLSDDSSDGDFERASDNSDEDSDNNYTGQELDAKIQEFERKRSQKQAKLNRKRLGLVPLAPIGVNNFKPLMTTILEESQNYYPGDTLLLPDKTDFDMQFPPNFKKSSVSSVFAIMETLGYNPPDNPNYCYGNTYIIPDFNEYKGKLYECGKLEYGSFPWKLKYQNPIILQNLQNMGYLFFDAVKTNTGEQQNRFNRAKAIQFYNMVYTIWLTKNKNPRKFQEWWDSDIHWSQYEEMHKRIEKAFSELLNMTYVKNLLNHLCELIPLYDDLLRQLGENTESHALKQTPQDIEKWQQQQQDGNTESISKEINKIANKLQQVRYDIDYLEYIQDTINNHLEVFKIITHVQSPFTHKKPTDIYNL